MIVPPFLKSGDTIAIVSPAGKVNPDFIFKTKQFLESKGFIVVVSPNADKNYFQYSGSDEQRIQDFQLLMNDYSVKAILCSRGGYGSIRIIEKLDFSEFEKNPKWIIGFSDITIFHACLNNIFDIASVHGPMTKAFFDEADGESVSYLIKMMTGNKIVYPLPEHKLNQPGKCSGRLIGGNLAILTSLIGTAYDFNPKGKILFIEDVGEYLYRIDRMMWQMKLAGKFNGLKAVILGQFSDMKDNQSPFGKNACEIIHEHLSEYKIPLYFDFQAGHEMPNIPLMLNTVVEIDKNQNLIFKS